MRFKRYQYSIKYVSIASYLDIICMPCETTVIGCVCIEIENNLELYEVYPHNGSTLNLPW